MGEDHKLVKQFKAIEKAIAEDKEATAYFKLGIIIVALNEGWEPDLNDNGDDYAQIGSSGYYAQIGSSGYYAQIGSSGDCAQINSTGEDSVIMCAGKDSIAKAKVGSWITLAEWVWDDKKKRSVPKCVKTEYVDGERIKADTWYQLKNGKFKEITD